MKQHEAKLLEILLEKLESSTNNITDWFFFDRPWLITDYGKEKPTTDREELKLENRYIIKQILELLTKAVYE